MPLDGDDQAHDPPVNQIIPTLHGGGGTEGSKDIASFYEGLQWTSGCFMLKLSEM